jgi:hypothetical protein
MRQQRADTFRSVLIASFERCRHPPITPERFKGIPADFGEEFGEYLECHARRYLIDHWLAGLGWQISASLDLATHLENIQIETGVESLLTGHRRFLDYFGFERESGSPLLIVEAKRPSLRLPFNENSEVPCTGHPASEVFARYLESKNTGGNLSDWIESGLTQEWREYLETLRDYVRSVARTAAIPRRVVVTNGEWLVVFRNPAQAFVQEDGHIDHAAILVFGSHKRLDMYYAEIFEELSYSSLAVDKGLVHPHDLPSLIRASDVSYAMYGQHVLYCSDRQLFKQAPRIELTPLVHLCTDGGGRLSVESADPLRFELTRGNDHEIDSQRNDVARAARLLKREIERELEVASEIPLRRIEDHYSDKVGFANLPGVRFSTAPSPKEQEFILVTGDSPHFITDPRPYAECPLPRRHRVLQ